MVKVKIRVKRLAFGFQQDYFSLAVEVEVNLRPTVSRPVRLGIGPPFVTLDQILSCSSFFC
jgi:hypothetical protein